MDQNDLEAAAEEGNATVVFDSSEQDNSQHPKPSSKDQFPGLDENQDRRLYNVARAVVEEVLRALPRLLQQQLRNQDKQYQALELASAEGRAVVGAKDNTEQVESDHVKHSSGRSYDGISASNSTSLASSLQGRADPAVSTVPMALVHQPAPDGHPLQSSDVGLPHLDYRQRADPMDVETIEAQNRHRRDVRDLWRGGEDWTYLEDPWKYIRRGNSRMFDDSTDEQRKELQLALIDALFACHEEPKLDEFFDRRLPAIACWISLIGVRLGNVVPKTALAIKQVEVLIECIWACKSQYPNSARVCDVLWSCFRRRILDQPSFHDPFDQSDSRFVLCTYITMVRIAVYLLNILYKPQGPPVEVVDDLDGAWSTPLAMVEKSMRCKQPEVKFSNDRGTFFAVSDFGLRDLQRIGQLRVQWTSYWDEHLELETIGSTTTLKLYWFSPTLSRFFQTTRLCGSLVDSDRYKRGEEVARTLDLVLNPYGKRKKSKAQYKKLEAPQWLTLFAHEELENWIPDSSDERVSTPSLPLSRFQNDRERGKPKFCCEVKDHMVSPYEASPTIERITFTRYPFYHQRLLELRSYMDSRQPRGLAALWRDRRNSNMYYTFWFVLVFGVSGIILTLGTLGVAILQAWGQLKSLHQ